jgi:hypothetical protein
MITKLATGSGSTPSPRTRGGAIWMKTIRRIAFFGVAFSGWLLNVPIDALAIPNCSNPADCTPRDAPPPPPAAPTPPAAPRGLQKKIQLKFADSAPDLFCGVASGGLGLKVFPKGEQRKYVETLLDTIYPEIVKIYGEPLAPNSNGIVTVTVYYVPGAGASMYLTHKSSIEIRVLAALVGSAIGVPVPATLCAALADIPDHALFLSEVPDLGLKPNDRGFDHLFTHEIIHAFHDRMDYMKWFTYSWVEEGMTEAAAELVADALVQAGGRDFRDASRHNDPRFPINNSSRPWDNLKHYDVWSYPFNGAWQGDPGFSILGGLRLFFGGFSLGGGGGVGLHKVIDPDVRYGAAADLWLLLAKALSPDPANLGTDFLKRLNAQLAADRVTELPGNGNGEGFLAVKKIGELIEKVAPGAMIEGLSVHDWLFAQGLLKGAPAGENFLFINVRDPENLQLDRNPITVYAIHLEDFPSDLNPLKLFAPNDLLRGELPARNCPVDVKILDAAGTPLVQETGKTRPDGRYVVKTVDTNLDPQKGVPPLPPGGYAIQASVGICDRAQDGASVGGMSASTYALVSGEEITDDIKKANFKLFGATVRPAEPSFFPGSHPVLKVVKATTAAEVVKPAFMDLHPSDQLGFITVDVQDPRALEFTNPLVFLPYEVDIGQKVPGSSKHSRTILKPNPYTRVVWVGTSPDFSISVAPSAATIRPGESGAAIVSFIPNGVRHQTIPPGCPVVLPGAAGGVPAGVTAATPLGVIALGELAPDPTKVPLRISVGREVRAGTYTLDVTTGGAFGTECGGLFRSANFLLTVPSARPLPASPVITDNLNSAVGN